MTPEHLKKILNRPMFRRRGVKVFIDWHDVWIGMFWKRTRWPWIVTTADTMSWRYDLFICLIPCVPIRIWWAR